MTPTDNDRVLRRTSKVTRRRPDPPQELRYAFDTNLLTWKQPSDTGAVTHYRIRVGTDDAAPSFQLSVGQTAFQLPPGTTRIFLTSMNDKTGLESKPLSIVTDALKSTLAPPDITAVSAPTITIDSVRDVVLLTFDLTFPADLKTMTAVFFGFQIPYPGAAVDTATNVPPPSKIQTLGPYILEIVGGIVQITQFTIIWPAPEIGTEVWSVEVVTASPTVTNPYLGSGPGFLTFEVSATAGLAPGEEWAPNPPNPLTIEIQRRVVRGSDQEWRFLLEWQLPDTADPRYKLIAKWAIGLLDPTITATGFEATIRTLASLAVTETTHASDWLRVPDVPVVYQIMVRPVTKAGKQNNYVAGVTCSIEARIAPLDLTVGREYADLVSNVAAVSGWDFAPTGSREFFIDCTWTNPASVQRFSGVVINLTNSSANFPGVRITGKVVGSSFRLVLAQKDGPRVAGTWYILVFSMDANDAVNTYLDGVTPIAAFPVESYFLGAPTLQASGFSVTSEYTDWDYNGIVELSLTVVFTPPDPAVDPSWAYVEFWAKRPDDGLWYNYFSPDKSGLLYAIGQLPKVTGTWHFLLVDRDTNGKNLLGESTTDPDAPPTGSATFSLSIAPPAVGAVGSEYAPIITSPVATIGAQVTQPDGTYRQLVTIAATLPDDSRFAGFKVLIKFTSGALTGKFEELVDISYPKATQDIIWKPPAGSITSRWYYVSYNKQGQLNTIDDPGITPYLDKTVGSTSQLDLSAANLANLNTSLLRINAATGLFEPYQIEQAIFAALQLGGGTDNGTCDTAGTAVHRLTGNNFPTSSIWNGKTIYIAGVPYTILTYIDADHLTLTSSAGTQSAVNWSYGRSPMLKIFDRSNALIFFCGDDSANTNGLGTAYVGTFAAKNFRAGGTLANPIFEVDSAGAVFITGTSTRPVTVSIDDGGAITITIDTTNFIKLINTGSSVFAQHHWSYFRVENSANADHFATHTLSGFTAQTSTSVLTTLTSSGLSVYDGFATSGMGVPPIYASVTLIAQNAAVGPVNIRMADGSVPAAGLYRLSAYSMVYQLGTAGSYMVTFGWNDGANARTEARVLGVTTLAGTFFSLTEVIKKSVGTEITYQVTTSGLTGSPLWAIYFTLERLN